YPFLWLIVDILALCPNLKTLQVIPSQYRHMSPDSALKMLADRGVQVRQGHIRPELAWSKNRIVNKNYLRYRHALQKLSLDARARFDELIAFGFKSARITARYYCLADEDYV